MGLCRRCKKVPARRKRAHYCRKCKLEATEESRVKANARTLAYYTEHKAEIKNAKKEFYEFIKKGSPEEVMAYFGLEHIEPAETQLSNKLRIVRQRAYQERHGNPGYYPIIRIPGEALHDRITRQMEAKYSKKRKKVPGTSPLKGTQGRSTGS